MVGEVGIPTSWVFMNPENPIYQYIYISRAVFPIVNFLGFETPEKSTASEESVILRYF